MQDKHVTANVTPTEKDDLAVLAFLHQRSSRVEAGVAIADHLETFKGQIKAVPKKQRALILAAAR